MDCFCGGPAFVWITIGCNAMHVTAAAFCLPHADVTYRDCFCGNGLYEVYLKFSSGKEEWFHLNNGDALQIRYSE